MRLQFLASNLAALWAGTLIAVGFISAPIIFKMMPDQRQFAGLIAGETFTAVTYVALFLGAIILITVRKINKDAGFHTPNAPLLWVLAALMLAITGEFIIHPMINELKAQAGSAHPEFEKMHLISTAAYAMQIACTLALSWSLRKPVQKPAGIESAVRIPEDEE